MDFKRQGITHQQLIVGNVSLTTIVRLFSKSALTSGFRCMMCFVYDEISYIDVLPFVDLCLRMIH